MQIFTLPIEFRLKIIGRGNIQSYLVKLTIIFLGFFFIGKLPATAQSFVHPGISHKQSDLDRMKMMAAVGKEPWKSSFANLSQNPFASYNYVVRGNSANTVIDATIGSEYNKIKFDGLAAYYNALMWSITGDDRHAKKAVEIFNAWVNIKRFVSGGTKALEGGRVIWKLLEGAEIIKSTYPGWQQADIEKFKAMLVYPGYSNTVVPTAAINSSDATFYWYMYNGDAGRYGNQGIFAMRGIMAMGIFLDNRMMYERALRYLTAQPRRSDDLPYVSGPPVVSATKSPASNEYYDEYALSGQSTTISDYGYDDQIQYYIYENGQGQEASRDQSHTITGISILQTIAEMAWNQGDDVYSYLDNRILSGLEYALRYNVSYKYPFPDQPSPWEPTVENGEYIRRRARSGRWEALKINPWNGADLTRLTRGTTFKSDESPIHEQVLAHYRDRIGIPAEKYKWTQRAFDISLNEFGYEGQGVEVDHPGYGGLTFRRANLSPGDPIQSFVSGQPIYGMNKIPGIIEAENYDHINGGGQAKTYYDADNSNSGGAYRTTEGVDVANCSEGGYAVVNMQPGEWLNYTVAIPKSGFYKVNIHYSSLNANGKIRFDFNGVNATGEIAVPFGGSNSTGANDWKDFEVATVSLNAGVQSMRIYVAGTESAFDLNNINITAVDPSQPPAAPSSLAAKAGNKQVALSWIASAGATSYKVKRATASSGPYITIATVDAPAYANTGLTNGTTYYYIVSAVNAVGESTNSTEATATPNDAAILIEDNFETGLGSLVTGRTPEVATIGNRVFQPSFTGASTTNNVISGGAQLATVMAEVVDISNADGYTKPSYINISGSFNVGTLENNTPAARPARGVYFGFWSSLSSGTVGFQNMRGVFVNPEDGELQLWNGSSSTTGTPVQSLPYQRIWNPSTQHTISYTINTATGNISDFVLDGVTYLWNKTNIFTDANTNYAGFGTSGATSGQYGNIFSFTVKDNKVWNEVVRSTQTINFPDFSDKKIGDADFNTGALASSGLPLTYVSSNPAVATVASDGTVDIVGAGKTTVTASQSGNASYETATPVSRELTVTNDGSAASRLLVHDEFSTGTGDVTGRTPEIATIAGRTFQKSSAAVSAANTATVSGGVAKLNANIAELVDINGVGGYVKPTYINVSATFDIGNITNPSASQRSGRGVFVGFWSAIPGSGDAITNMRGVVINPLPATGQVQLCLWNGGTSTATPLQTLAYSGTWSNSIQHTVSYTVNTTTGNISDFILDGVTYTWNTVTVFSNTNTRYAGFGANGSSSTQFGNVSSFKITNVSPQVPQTITFPAITNRKIGDADFNPRATSSVGLPVSYSSSNPSVATIVNGLVQIVGEGVATITATQSGNSDYLPATASQELTVKRSQVITFHSLSDKFVGDADFILTATASSDLPITYTSSNIAVAAIVNGNQVHIVAQGNATITASQAGDDTYAPATAQTQLQVVKKVNQSINFDALPAKHVGDVDFDPAAIASSGLPVTYTSADENVATIVNGQIHIVGEGTILITASQGGDAQYNSATSITQTLTVTKQDQSITFDALPEKQLGEADFNLAATSSSGLPITYTSSDESVATIVNGVVHIVAKGTTLITASQAGNAMFKAATPVSQQLKVYIPPTVVAKNVEVEVDEHGNASITPQSVDDGSVSHSGTLALSLDKSNFTCSDIGAPVTVTLTATDAEGHASSATAQVNVLDKINPTVTAPADVTINADNGRCSALGTSLGTASASDNCAVQSVTSDAPTIFSVGTTVVTWTVKDVHGNISTAKQTVIVIDNQKPSVTATSNRFFCYAGSSYLLPALSASDNCGISTITYAVTGATVRSGMGEDASGIFNVGTSTVTWTVTDIHGNANTASTIVTINDQFSTSIPDVYALNSQTDAKNTLYIGYGPASLTIAAAPAGGTSPYTYKWSTGEITKSISVNTAGTYRVTVVDTKGCTSSASIVIHTINVECGNNNNKVMVCHNGKVICISSEAVKEHLNHGDQLGPCDVQTTAAKRVTAAQAAEPSSVSNVTIYPNPVTETLKVTVGTIHAGATLQLFNADGGLVYSKRLTNLTEVISVQKLAAGVYYLKVNNKETITKKILKS